MKGFDYKNVCSSQRQVRFIGESQVRHIMILSGVLWSLVAFHRVWNKTNEKQVIWYEWNARLK